MHDRNSQVDEEQSFLNAGSVATRTLLRQRKRQAALMAQSTATFFGHVDANAYINARQIRQSKKSRPTAENKTNKRKQTKKALNKDDQDEESDQDVVEEAITTRSSILFVTPSSSEMQQALAEADARAQQRLAMQNKASESMATTISKETFERWRGCLLCGNNILVYGVGSKRPLFQEFVDNYCQNAFVLQLHGYLPKVSLEYVCNFINEHVLCRRSTSKKLLHQCQDIAAISGTAATGGYHVHSHLRHVYLVVHSLDGVALRSLEAQTCLSVLSTASFVHIVASIDQINAPALWQEADFNRFRWIYQHVNTCAPYDQEFKLQVSSMVKGMDHSSSGITYIIQSLTPSDVSTLKIIAELQVNPPKVLPTNDEQDDNEDEAPSTRKRASRKSFVHPDYHQVYEICRKKMIHKSAQTMRNSIRCLEDHGLVKLVRVANVEKLMIPIAASLIKSSILNIS